MHKHFSLTESAPVPDSPRRDPIMTHPRGAAAIRTDTYYRDCWRNAAPGKARGRLFAVLSRHGMVLNFEGLGIRGQRGRIASAREHPVISSGGVIQMKKTFLSGIALALVTAAGIGSASADVSGVLKMCTNCHGDNGVSTQEATPTIGGIFAEYQENALRHYRDGSRSCVDTPMMCKAAKRLSDEQIEELAHYFGDMPYHPAKQEFDADLAAKGKELHDSSGCAMCHGDSPDDADSAILHGQKKAYLSMTLKAYAADERDQPRAMSKAIKTMSPEDLEALTNYYASFTP